MFGRDKNPGPPPPDRFGPGLDPELAELMRMEEEERLAGTAPGSGFGGAGPDPELAELMRMEEAERTGLVPPGASWDNPAGSAGPASPGAREANLRLLAEMHAEGVLSDAEFEAEKARILRQPG